MSEFVLNKLLITGDITSDTPVCVLEEIKTCSIFRNLVCNLQETIVTYTYLSHPKLSHPYTTSDLDNILIYINPTVKWTREQLLTAFEYHRLQLDDDYDVPEFSTLGLPTPHQPNSLSACVLYKLCKRNNIPVSRMSDMIYMHSALAMKSSTDIRANIIGLINLMSVSQLQQVYHNLYLQTKEKRELAVTPFQYEFNYETTLEKSAQLFLNADKMRFRITPLSNADAIILAAMNYDTDIYFSPNPILEYLSLQMNKSTYIPLHQSIGYEYTQSRDFVDLRVTFNPFLPKNVYTQKNLEMMALEEGFTDNELVETDPYSLLQTSSTVKTFYIGIKFPNSGETAIYKDTIDQNNYWTYVSYGSKIDNDWTVYIYNELKDMFSVNKSYKDQNNEMFNEISIRKLRKICMKRFVSDAAEILDDRMNLLRSMIDVELFTSSYYEKLKTFVEQYQKYPTVLQAKIIIAFNKLFKLSLSMRGWNSVDELLPIEEAITLDSELNNVFDRVYIDIVNFENYIIDIGPIGEEIMNLPLLLWDRGDWHVSSNQDEGLTIQDRINIIKEGETHPTMVSCIRTSSNWLLSSSYRYLEMLDNRLNFDIRNMRFIS